MSKTVSFDLPDEVYEALERMAIASGRSTDALALEWLARHVPKERPEVSEQARAAALKKLRAHAGRADSHDPHAADNEPLDATLASEFANRDAGAN